MSCLQPAGLAYGESDNRLGRGIRHGRAARNNIGRAGYWITGPERVIGAKRRADPVDDLGDGPYVQLWPHRQGTDAMFAAALQVM